MVTKILEAVKERLFNGKSNIKNIKYFSRRSKKSLAG